jgi:hypothetical protein
MVETMIVVMKLLITQSSNNDDHESEMDQCDIIEAQRQPRSLRTPSVITIERNLKHGLGARQARIAVRLQQHDSGIVSKASPSSLGQGHPPSTP